MAKPDVASMSKEEKAAYFAAMKKDALARLAAGNKSRSEMANPVSPDDPDFSQALANIADAPSLPGAGRSVVGMVNGGQPTAILARSTPALAPEGLTAGIYFIVTKWLAPIAANIIEATITALIVSGTQAFEKEYRITGADIFSIFNQLLAIIGGTADAYSVPMSGGFNTSEANIAALMTTLSGL